MLIIKYADSLKNTLSPIDDLIDENDLTDQFKKCRTLEY
jgi:hypothetical protein